MVSNVPLIYIYLYIYKYIFSPRAPLPRGPGRAAMEDSPAAEIDAAAVAERQRLRAEQQLSQHKQEEHWRRMRREQWARQEQAWTRAERGPFISFFLSSRLVSFTHLVIITPR